VEQFEAAGRAPERTLSVGAAAFNADMAAAGSSGDLARTQTMAALPGVWR
jgi:hypothetical protein